MGIALTEGLVLVNDREVRWDIHREALLKPGSQQKRGHAAGMRGLSLKFQ